MNKIKSIVLFIIILLSFNLIYGAHAKIDKEYWSIIEEDDDLNKILENKDRF